MIYSCNEQGVEALTKMSAAIEHASVFIPDLAEKLNSIAEGYKNQIGPHSESIVDICEEITNIMKQTNEPICNISENLRELAFAYNEIISNDPFNNLADSKNNTSSNISNNLCNSENTGYNNILGAHSAIEDAYNTNPNFNKDSIEWAHNCQRCVPAYEMRRRGYDVQAKPRPTETIKSVLFGDKVIPSRNDKLSLKPFDVWIPPDSIKCNEQLDIENHMNEWGDGARCEIMVLWEGEHGAGHVFVAEQIKGVTHFIDPQSGKDSVAYYFDRCDKNNIYICRTDDKEISDLISECC